MRSLLQTIVTRPVRFRISTVHISAFPLPASSVEYYTYVNNHKDTETQRHKESRRFLCVSVSLCY